MSFVGALSVLLTGLPGLAVPASAAGPPPSPSATLTQCANGKASGAEQPCSWVPGNLNPHANSQYREDDSVPFRVELGGLVDTGPAHVYELTIGWDTIEGGDVAYDFLTTWNCSESGTPATNPPAAGAPDDTIAIPDDPRITDAGVADQAGGCGPNVFTMWGGDLTSVSAYAYSDGGSTVDPYLAANVQTTVTVTFTATATNATLAWGGHVARRGIWNNLDATNRHNTASQDRPNASPYHVRLSGDLLDNGTAHTLGKSERSMKPIASVAAFEFTKTASVTNPTPSTTFDYTLTAANTGDVDGGAWTISDPIPAGLTALSVTPNLADPKNGCSLAGNDLSCTFESLAKLSSQVVTVKVHVPALACGAYDNTATFTHSATTIDASATVTVGPCAILLTARKSVDVSEVLIGGAVTWTVTAVNDATAKEKATGVVITDTIDDMFASIAATWSVDAGATTTPCGVAGQVVTCTVGTVAPGVTALVSITANAKSTPADPSSGVAECDTTNTATVAADHLATPLTTTPATATKVKRTPVVPLCETKVRPEKTLVTTGAIPPGGFADFRIRLTNSGNVDELDLKVTEVPPAGWTLVSMAVGAVPCAAAPDCIVDVPAGGFTDIAVRLQAPTGDQNCHDWTNVARIYGEVEGTADVTVTCVVIPPTPPTTPTPTTTAPLPVPGDPGILVQKSADQSLLVFDPDVEQVVTYTYVVANTGAVTLTDVTVEDDVLGPISLPTTTLEPGDKVTGSATHVVTEADVEARRIVNVATATGIDPDGGFIQSIDTVTVQVDPPAAVLGVVEERPEPEPAPDPVPAPDPAEVLPQVEEQLPATGTSTTEAGPLALLMLLLGALLVHGSRLPAPDHRRL